MQDKQVSQGLYPMYLFHLTKYKQVLRQRNELLKQIGLNKDLLDTLDIWNSELVKYGNYVISARKSFIDKLNDYIQEIHKNLTGQRETITLRYEPSVREILHVPVCRKAPEKRYVRNR